MVANMESIRTEEPLKREQYITISNVLVLFKGNKQEY